MKKYDEKQTFKQYQLIIENLREGIAFVDPNETFMFSNPASDKLFGVSRGGLIGKNLKEFTSSKYFDLINEQTQLRKSNLPGTYELEIIRADNEKRYIRISVNPIFDNNNNYIGASSSFFDITQKKRYEKDLEHLNRVLFTMKNINTFLSRENNINKIFQKTCNYLLDIPGYEKVWIVQNNKNKNFSIVNKAGKGIDLYLILQKYSNCINKIFRKQCIYCLKEFITDNDEFSSVNKNTKLLITRIEHNKHFYSLLIIQISDAQIINKMEENLINEISDNVAYALYNIKLENTLKKELENIKKYLDIANVILIALDNNGNITMINNKVCEILEIDQNKIIGVNLFKTFILKNDRDKNNDFLKQIVSKEMNSNKTTEYYIITATGKKKLISWHNSLIRDKYNKIIGILCIGIDITQQQIIKNQLLLLATVVQQASEMIIVTDSKGDIEFVNKSFENITGYNKNDVLGKKPLILKSGKQNIIFYNNLWNTISNGNTWRGVITNRKKNGELYTEKATIFPVKDTKGNITNYAAVMYDISKDIEIEKKLLQSQKLETIGQLTGGISHDFNNLLTVISGYAEIERSLCDINSNSYKSLSSILKASNQASSLIKKLLTFSRKDSPQSSIVQLNDIINNLKDIINRLISENIKLIYTLNNDLPLIKAEPAQIEQILINLAVNAMDAILANKNPNKKTITFKTSKLFNTSSNNKGILEGSYILLSISDTGVGIPNAIINKVFNPFFTTKKRGKGTGLGLSTVYGIVKQNSGSITINSIINKGTTFNIYLPAFRNNSSINTSKENNNTNLEIVHGTGTILIVEDNEIVKEIGNEMLNTAGYTVISFSGGEEVLHWLKKHSNHKIDLLFTDMILKGISGKELVNNIRKFNPDIKILYTSGYTNNYLSKEDIADTNISFIQKPYSAVDLTIKIKTILES